MSRILKRILLLLPVVLLVVLLCLVLFTEKTKPLQSFRLPDGAVITFLETTYGGNQTLVWGKSFQRSLYRILPAKLKSLSRASVFNITTAETNVPTFWMHESTTNNAGTATAPRAGDLAVRILDEYGCEFDPNAFSTGTQYLPDGIIHYYHVNAADPHGGIIGLCLYDSSAKTRRLATFMIPGAALLPMPIAKTPLTPPKQDGEFGFQLVSFVTGLKSVPFAYTKMTNGVLFSQAVFQITRNGAPATNWYPSDIKISDAKGKFIPFRAREMGFQEGDNVFNFEAALNPVAGPFKLRVEFMHQTGFSPDETATFKDVPFPEPSETLSPGLEAEIQGRRLALEYIYGAFAPKPAKFFSPGETVIQARLSPTTNSVHLELADVVDQDGAVMPKWGHNAGSKGLFYFGFPSAVKAKTMTVTFAVHQSRFAEFEAMPVLFRSNGSDGK